MIYNHTEVELLSTDKILSLPSPSLPEHDRGIYFLIQEGKIRYVGKSESNILARIAAHRKSCGGEFGRFVTICPEHECLEYVEALYIREINPDLNKYTPCPDAVLLCFVGNRSGFAKRGRKDWLSAVASIQMKAIYWRHENENLADATDHFLKEINANSPHFSPTYKVPAYAYARLCEIETKWQRHENSRASEAQAASLRA